MIKAIIFAIFLPLGAALAPDLSDLAIAGRWVHFASGFLLSAIYFAIASWAFTSLLNGGGENG